MMTPDIMLVLNRIIQWQNVVDSCDNISDILKDNEQAQEALCAFTTHLNELGGLIYALTENASCRLTLIREGVDREHKLEEILNKRMEIINNQDSIIEKLKTLVASYENESIAIKAILTALRKETLS